MNKIILLFIGFLLFSPYVLAQKKADVLTTFFQDGTLYKNQNDFSELISDFEENDSCTVLDYMGKDIYKIQYKGNLGYVSTDDLEITEAMMDMYYDYQEKARQKVINARIQRSKKFSSLPKQENIETKKLDSITKAKEAQQLALIAQQKQDSLSEIETQQNLLLAEQKKTDSIALAQYNNTISDIKNQETHILQKQEPTNIEHKKVTRSTDCKYLINEYDDFYNVKTIQTDPYILSNKLTIELYRLGRKLNIFFNLSENLGCASYMSHNRSSVKVTLENNQTVSFYHSWGMDCGNFTFKGKLSTSQIKRLLESPIKSILLRGTKSSMEITDITNKYFFIDKLHCLELED